MSGFGRFFQPPPSPLQEGKEGKIPSALSNRWFHKQAQLTLNKMRQEINDLPKRRDLNQEQRDERQQDLESRIKALNVAVMQHDMGLWESKKNDDILAEFRDFLLGKSIWNNDFKKVPWGRRKLVGRDIDVYLESIMDAKMKYDFELGKMKHLGIIPQGLREAWMYFCYVVKEMDGNAFDAYLSTWDAFYPSPLLPGQDMDKKPEAEERDEGGGSGKVGPEEASYEGDERPKRPLKMGDYLQVTTEPDVPKEGPLPDTSTPISRGEVKPQEPQTPEQVEQEVKMEEEEEEEKGDSPEEKEKMKDAKDQQILAETIAKFQDTIQSLESSQLRQEQAIERMAQISQGDSGAARRAWSAIQKNLKKSMSKMDSMVDKRLKIAVATIQNDNAKRLSLADKTLEENTKELETLRTETLKLRQQLEESLREKDELKKKMAKNLRKQSKEASELNAQLNGVKKDLEWRIKAMGDAGVALSTVLDAIAVNNPGVMDELVQDWQQGLVEMMQGNQSREAVLQQLATKTGQAMEKQRAILDLQMTKDLQSHQELSQRNSQLDKEIQSLRAHQGVLQNQVQSLLAEKQQLEQGLQGLTGLSNQEKMEMVARLNAIQEEKNRLEAEVRQAIQEKVDVLSKTNEEKVALSAKLTELQKEIALLNAGGQAQTSLEVLVGVKRRRPSASPIYQSSASPMDLAPQVTPFVYQGQPSSVDFIKGAYDKLYFGDTQLHPGKSQTYPGTLQASFAPDNIPAQPQYQTPTGPEQEAVVMQEETFPEIPEDIPKENVFPPIPQDIPQEQTFPVIPNNLPVEGTPIEKEEPKKEKEKEEDELPETEEQKRKKLMAIIKKHNDEGTPVPKLLLQKEEKLYLPTKKKVEDLLRKGGFGEDVDKGRPWKYKGPLTERYNISEDDLTDDEWEEVDFISEIERAKRKNRKKSGR